MYVLESGRWLPVLLCNTACLHQAKSRWTMQGQWFPVWCIWHASQINTTHHLYSGYITYRDWNLFVYCFQQEQGGVLVKRCISLHLECLYWKNSIVFHPILSQADKQTINYMLLYSLLLIWLQYMTYEKHKTLNLYKITAAQYIRLLPYFP